MKELLKITAATAALTFGISVASADMLLHSDQSSDEKKVINTETQSEAPVLMSSDGQPPTDCPEGSFFLFSDATDDKQVVTECVTGRRFVAGEIPEGTFRSGDIPEGAMLLTDASGNKEVVTEGEADRNAAPMQQQR